MAVLSNLLDVKLILCLCTLCILTLIYCCYDEYETNREIDYKNWIDLIGKRDKNNTI